MKVCIVCSVLISDWYRHEISVLYRKRKSIRTALEQVWLLSWTFSTNPSEKVFSGSQQWDLQHLGRQRCVGQRLRRVNCSTAAVVEQERLFSGRLQRAANMQFFQSFHSLYHLLTHLRLNRLDERLNPPSHKPSDSENEPKLLQSDHLERWSNRFQRVWRPSRRWASRKWREHDTALQVLATSLAGEEH